MREDNLVPMHQTKEEATINGRKGGIASGKARREKKALREIALKMLNSTLPPEMAKKLSSFKMLGKCDTSFNAAVIAKQIEQALKGNVNSARFLMEASDQKATEKQELSGGLNNRNEVVVAKDSITADVYNKIMRGDGD